MSLPLMRTSLMATFVATLALCGCSGKAPRIEAPPIDPVAAAAEAMNQYDTNKDTFIAGEELDKAPALKASMETLDQDKDGKVSTAEIEARINAWIESLVAIMPLPITVNKGGRPLAGATVKIIPEAFLGTAVEVAEGVTDERGQASPSIPPDPDNPNLRGVRCGFYRVEITKDGTNIPAKYNTETTLGVEASQGNPQLQTGIVFEL